MKDQAQWWMLAGGVVFGLLGSLVVAPSLFPSTAVRGGPVNLSASVCVGVCAMLGAFLGGLFGRWFHRPGR